MKRIIALITLLIVAITTQAQSTKYQIGTPTRDVEVMRDIYMDRDLYLGVRSDTNFTPTRRGTVITRAADNLPYYWNGLKWYSMMNSGIGNPIGITNNTTRLVHGDATWSGIGLIYDVTACDYYILGRHFNSLPTQKTLTNSDPVLPRIDVIYVDTSGLVGVITGIPGASPIKPIVNPLSQLELTNVNVAAGASTPTIATQTVVYDENTEWTSAGSGTTSFTYVSNPQHGSFSARIQSTVNPFTAEYLRFTCDSAVPIANYKYLRFYIRLKTALVNNASAIQIYMLHNNSPVIINSGIVLTHGAYGFDRLLINTWQLITIPLVDFIYTNSAFDVIKFIPPNEVGDWHIDNVVLQSGSVPANLSYVSSFNGRQGAVTSQASDYSTWYLDRDSLLADLPLSVVDNGTNMTVTMQEADESNDGYLTAADYTLFKNNTGYFEASGSGIRTKLDRKIGLGMAANATYWLDVLGGARFGSDLNINTITIGKGAGNVVDNTVLGYQALSTNVTNNQNTIVGYQASRLSGGIGNNAFQNTIMGYQTMQQATTGNDNTIVGAFGMWYTTGGVNMNNNTGMGKTVLGRVTGPDNIGIGKHAAINITSGGQNTIVGTDGAATLTTGSRNITLGASADVLVATGHDQINIGNKLYGRNGNFTIGTAAEAVDSVYKLGVYGTFKSTLDASINELVVGKGANNIASNTAFGRLALNASTGTGRNVAVGNNAGLTMTTGLLNVIIGDNAGMGLFGNGSVAIGGQAMQLWASGNYNTAVGYDVMTAAGTGTGNSGFGKFATHIITSGSYNTGIGQSALSALTSGSNNTALGQQAGTLLTTGSFNIAIGDSTNLPDPTGSYQLNIGKYIWGNNNKLTIGLYGYADSANRLTVLGTMKVTDTLKTPNIAAKALDYLNYSPVVVDGSGNHFKTDWQQKTARVSTQYDKTTNVSLSDIPGLTVTLSASKTYSFEAILYGVSGASGGVKYAIGGTCTATNIIYEDVTTNNGSFVGGARSTSLGGAVTVATTVTAPYTRITGTITVNAGGTLTVQFAQNVSDGVTSSVLVGSVFKVTEIL